MFTFYKKIFFLIFSFSFLSASFVQAYTCPNFKFEKNIQKNEVNEDVRVIQEILNADKRTIVAYRGLGSKGNETALFGRATREALKRFQALFIEYIEVADGKFNEKTRNVMNKVCKGPFFSGNAKSPYDLATSTDVVAPVIALAGPATSTADQSFRMYLGGNEAINPPGLDKLILSGGSVSDIRKQSSTTYTFLVTPDFEVKDEISIQLEADSVEDLAGNKNESASNEWIVKIAPGGSVTSTTTDWNSLLDDILKNIGNASSTDCTKVTVDIKDYNNPCYGRSPMSGVADTGNQQKDKDNQMMQMLMGLLQGLLKGLGGLGGAGSKGGGNGTPCGVCMCPGPYQGHPIVNLMPMGGSVAPGGYDMIANPGAGFWTGSVMPMGGVCGQAYNPKTGCQAPQMSSGGCPFIGVIPAGDVFKWNR